MQSLTRTNQLFLALDTNATCPKCDTELSLQEGFAKKALEQLSESSAVAIAAMRDAERRRSRSERSSWRASKPGQRKRKPRALGICSRSRGWRMPERWPRFGRSLKSPWLLELKRCR